jgi:hypothetical protein
MNWSHAAVLIVAVAAGYWLHSKMPGLLSKVSGGIVAA